MLPPPAWHPAQLRSKTGAGSCAAAAGSAGAQAASAAAASAPAQSGAVVGRGEARGSGAAAAGWGGARAAAAAYCGRFWEARSQHPGAHGVVDRGLSRATPRTTLTLLQLAVADISARAVESLTRANRARKMGRRGASDPVL
jgi:hypothetical protein